MGMTGWKQRCQVKTQVRGRDSTRQPLGFALALAPNSIWGRVRLAVQAPRGTSGVIDLRQLTDFADLPDQTRPYGAAMWCAVLLLLPCTGSAVGGRQGPQASYPYPAVSHPTELCLHTVAVHGSLSMIPETQGHLVERNMHKVRSRGKP